MQKKERLIDIVTQLLTEDRSCRNSDPALFRAIINRSYDIEGYSYSAISKLQEQGKIPSHESMRRCRQKCQADNPELRGDVHDKRQQLGEEVRPLINSEFEQATLLF